ncbi:MAG: aldehyde dehydrogenase family protein, partial [Gammaproteobacteria bacterium]
MTDASTPVVSPADTRVTLGLTRDATADEIRAAMQAAHEAQPAWDARGAAERAACLERAAELLQARRGNFLSLLVREAGKTLPDALA